MTIEFVPAQWVDVPDEDNPPVGAPATDATQMLRIEQGIVDVVEHANALYAAHNGMVYYTGASSAPPPNPPTNLLWIKSDTGDFVRNTGTSGAPVWSPIQSDDSKLTASDFLSDYVVSGLLPPVPSNSLTLAIPAGRAYVNYHLLIKALAGHTVPDRKRTLVDVSDEGVFSNVDYGVLIDDCEDAWAEKTDADFTQSIVTGPSVTDNALRFAIASTGVAGDYVTEAIPSTDLSPYNKIRVTLRSSVAVSAGALQILLDNSAQCTSPVHTLNLPALAANAWTTVELPYTPGTGSEAIISVGLKYTSDFGAANVDIASVWATKTNRPAVTPDSVRLFEAAADAYIAQRDTVTVTTATNSTDYTININTLDVVYTADASTTKGEIALGLVAAINASVSPLVTPITASTTAIATDTATATITLLADQPGVPFTAIMGTGLSSTTDVPNSYSNVIEVIDLRPMTPTVRGTVGHVINSGGVALPQRRTLELTGSLSATDDEANNRTLVAGPAGGTTVILGTDVANSTTALADVTGLSFPATAGQIIRIYAIIEFDAALATTGSRWTLNGPAGLKAITTRWSSGASSNTLLNTNAYDSVSASANSAATQGNLAIIEGILRPTASGTVVVRFASEIAASAITAKAGSSLTYST